MLQRLEQQGILERHRPATNRRTAIVSLTTKGRQLQQDVQRIWVTLEEATTLDMTGPEKRKLSQLLTRLEHNLSRKEDA